MILNRIFIGFIIALVPLFILSQDLSKGLKVNDLSPHQMEDIAKPGYLETITDPAFGTIIRRITNADPGDVIVPMYSTVQAWNANETLMILYNQSTGNHELLDGINYQFIRELSDIDPFDIEQIFWDFHDPDILYYPDKQSKDFIRYTVTDQSKQTLVNLVAVSQCNGGLSMGNDVQMMSWDSDVFTFRCDNEISYAYRISTGELTNFNISDLAYAAPGVAPSGQLFYHKTAVYDSTGNMVLELNLNKVEHSCLGKLPNGNDAYYAIAFEEGSQGGCIGDVIAHDLVTGECFPVISESQGYNYPQSGTHISALAHKNTEGGWLAASMMGYDRDGQALLDQELVIVRAEKNAIKVCRIGHHRSDEDEFDYWGEPHAVISPTGTRVLFASDWSGVDDGQSVDSYVLELPVFSNITTGKNHQPKKIRYRLHPNPVEDHLVVEFDNPDNGEMAISIYNLTGREILSDQSNLGRFEVDINYFISGMYFFVITDFRGVEINGKFIKH